ncbi:hypothetical protein CROQUDRAFT_656316 [Cronartium quercuum f. sp. fusiforme G11]|uniref:Ribokinase n=1 Tax=Cronartium quercuum f. sp. fusiforme G11 TaxID=708437 RepID=A0A9P6NKD6_9BASI|nr:hypothetical protein CROQUDRAFT_656316 [Cronartium quercuum f. sp. fusiforme G11]
MDKPNVRKACLVRSSINIDEYLSVEHIVQPGQTINSSAYSRRVGGKGANGAVALAKAGANVSFAGLIGKDAAYLKQTIESYGVNAEQLKMLPELPTGRAIIQVARSTGENSIVLVSGANHAASHLWPVLGIDRALYSHVLLQNEIPLVETVATLMSAHDHGVCTVFNPSPLPSQTEIRDTIPWSAVDWLVVNEEEGRSLVEASQRCSQLNVQFGLDSEAEDQSSELKKIIQSSFANVGVVLTLGARGCQVGFCTSCAESKWDIFNYPAYEGTRPVLDTTGAGDCFTGYLVAQLMDLDNGSDHALTLADVKRAIKVAGKAARLCVEKEGTIDSYPSLMEVN